MFSEAFALGMTNEKGAHMSPQPFQLIKLFLAGWSPPEFISTSINCHYHFQLP
jgi:hypothetical protein